MASCYNCCAHSRVHSTFCTCCLPYAARCNSTWIEHVDSNVSGGTVISSATDVPACQSACVQLSNCTGFDFNPASPASSRCFLIFDDYPLINEGLVKGVTHYERVVNCSDTDAMSYSTYDSKLMTFHSIIITVIQGHRSQCQYEAHIRFPVSYYW